MIRKQKFVTVAEAAEMTGVHPQTIYRGCWPRKDPPRPPRFPNAVDDGKWMIPIADLVAAGLTLGESTDDAYASLTQENEALREENAALRQRLAVAEAVAAERLRVLDALTGGKPSTIRAKR